MKNKRALTNLYKDIVLVTCVRVFCTTLCSNNNIKIVIKSSTFLDHRLTLNISANQNLKTLIVSTFLDHRVKPIAERR